MSCRATVRPTALVASVTRMCTWAPFPTSTSTIGKSSTVTRPLPPPNAPAGLWPVAMLEPRLLQGRATIRGNGDLGTADVFMNRGSGLRPVGDHRQGARSPGRAPCHKRLLGLPIAVERRRPCLDGADALPLDQSLPGRLPVDRGLHVLPTEFVGRVGAVHADTVVRQV